MTEQEIIKELEEAKGLTDESKNKAIQAIKKQRSQKRISYINLTKSNIEECCPVCFEVISGHIYCDWCGQKLEEEC